MFALLVATRRGRVQHRAPRHSSRFDEVPVQAVPDAARQGRKRARSRSVSPSEPLGFVDEADGPDEGNLDDVAAPPAAMTLEEAEEATMLQELEEFGTPRPFLRSFPLYSRALCAGSRLILEENSELVNKGLHPMALSNAALSPVLRLLLAQEVPVSVRHVVMTVPESTAGKLLFNAVRHVLNLSRYDAAAVMDLQRLQMCSQLIGVVRHCCSTFPLDLLGNRLSLQ